MPSFDTTFGAMFIGLLFAVFFQGVLTVQTYAYYENFPNDNRRTKWLVAIVWIIDLVHLVFISHANYHYLVNNWGNPLALGFSIWSLDSHLWLIGIATLMCQAFFIHRIWLFSNKNVFLLVALVAPCLATFGLDISISIQIMQKLSFQTFQALTPDVIALFSIGAGIDVIIALMMCYFLRRGRSGFEKTNSIIATLLRYTITTGLATSALAVGCLVAYFASPGSFVFVAMHFSLGRMYTNALLATLNSRKSLRAAMDGTGLHHRAPSTKPGTASFGSGSRSPGASAAYKGGNVSIQLEQTYQTPDYGYKTNHDDSDIELQIHAGVPDTFKGPPLGV